MAVRISPQSPLRVAVIGCGAVSQQMHLPILAGHPAFELVALVDSNRKRAERWARDYRVARVFSDASDLSAELIDATVIATPPVDHPARCIDLMRRGLHVLVEKPMAIQLADAESMVAVAKETGRVLSVGYFRRLFPSVSLLKHLLEDAAFGPPQSFQVSGGGVYNWAAVTLANLRKETAGGGVLMDFGSHMIDLMFAVFGGAPAEVLQYRDNSRGGIEADCSIDVELQYRNVPLSGRVELARSRVMESGIRVECEQATLVFHVNERFRVQVIPKRQATKDGVANSTPVVMFEAGWLGQETDESWYATFAREYDDWLQAIRSGGEPVLSGPSTLPTSQFIDACYRNPRPLVESWVDGGVCDAATIDRSLAVPRTRQPARRVLVTGASGFIGSRLVETLRLRENCEVRAVVNNPANAARLSRLDIEMVQADLGSDEPLDALVDGCDAVFHCAVGTAYGQPQALQNVTIRGTQRLGEAALKARVRRFVHLSSMGVYGTDQEVPAVISETYGGRAIRATSFYGWMKAQAEMALIDLHRQGLPVVILRPARVFGPYGKTFIENPLRAMTEKRFSWAGDPNVPCDMVYVDNVVQACMEAWLAEGPGVIGESFNISDGDGSSWREFFSFFADPLGFDMSGIPQAKIDAAVRRNWMHSLIGFPVSCIRGCGQILFSAEMKSLGKRVLATDPIGTLPRNMLNRSPGLEKLVRRIVGADDAPAIYEPAGKAAAANMAMGSCGAVLSIDKARSQLHYQPAVSRAQALALTLDWWNASRVVNRR